MVGIEKLYDHKNKILSTISIRGPSLPVQISKAINMSLLFTSAFLSELFSEKKVKISNLRIGSSPLYFIEGQEEKLENFIEHLNQREKEAFILLKKEKILDDEKQTPVVRVALREIKDFAVPINIKSNEGIKLFWKFFTTTEEEIKNIFQMKEPTKEEIISPKKEVEEIKEIIKEKKQKTEIKEESNFSKKIKDYISSKDIEITDILTEKKKELKAKIRIDIIFGKQEFLLIAKDKKKLFEKDLISLTEEIKNEKLPLYIIIPGDLDKKAKEYLRLWKNLIRVEKIPK